MNDLYSGAVREFIRSREWPKEFKWMIEQVNHPDMEYLQFVIYRHNLNEFEDGVVVQITNMINEMFMHLRTQGTPIYVEVRQ